MKRYGQSASAYAVPAKLERGIQRLHAAVWPDVLKMIAECNIRNYSIYLRTLDDGQPYLFGYFEYVGNDFEADMARWRPTRRRSAGGPLQTLPATAGRPRRANGGRPWRKCFTSTAERPMPPDGTLSESGNASQGTCRNGRYRCDGFARRTSYPARGPGDSRRTRIRTCGRCGGHERSSRRRAARSARTPVCRPDRCSSAPVRCRCRGPESRGRRRPAIHTCAR